MAYDVTASIVLYKNDKAVRTAIDCFLNSSFHYKLYLVDNSPTNYLETELKDVLANKRVEYFFNNKNAGFGAAHNVALKKIVDTSLYHLVLNPDVTFSNEVLYELFRFMEDNKEVGQLMPKVYYENGELQKLCKLLPTPFDLFGRRFCRNARWAEKLNSQYELKGFNYDECISLPNLSGCFMFLRSAHVKKIGFFDERYFMYMEDIDFTRRMHTVAKTIFYPHVSIVHDYKKGSYQQPRLLKYHMESAIKYFNKWGWYADAEREEFNKAVLHHLDTHAQRVNMVRQNRMPVYPS